MSRVIVCGIDDGGAVEAVAETARWLANHLGARLVLVHVAEEPLHDAEQGVASIRVRLGLGARDDVHVVAGHRAARLLERAEADGAALLVVGSRGRGAVQSALFGSVSRTLATNARCPVVIVPPGAPDVAEFRQAGGSVVCGVDGSGHALSAVQLGAALASALGLRLIVVHARADARERDAQEIVDRAVASVGGEATGVVEAGSPHEVLEAVAAQHAGRLLVVAARGLSAVRSAVLGSSTAELVGAARRPVVVLPADAALDGLVRLD
jgi:nucleotide-binding universal stress UspA family protein